ncbi:hypothetical protein Patl1_03975 [Pistacia atlantica]|uniref:Uncharacterized protein n=1 Tax=Pistacia atlantica TaxID=434234 RepID=A0ACC1BUM3_9ROSI|nr:hypothetical protein Patl1_03975 [Pistacia atlantica]
MATNSISATILPSFTIPISSNPKLSSFSCSLPSKVSTFKLSTAVQPSVSASTRVFAAPETLDGTETSSPEVCLCWVFIFVIYVFVNAWLKVLRPLSPSVSTDADKIAPKQKIRIKLRSYWVPLIEDSCKQIMDAARTTNAKTMGPVPLPTKKRIYCVLKSPHVHKDARFHFEIRTHQRLIDILYPTAQTIDSLMQLDLPAGVDVEVKL